MKTIAQIFLTFIFVLSFVVALISAIIKFELLNYRFISQSLNKHNVYSNLSLVVKNSIESQVGKGGGKINDIAVITDLITTENTKDAVNKNLFNLLSFINGNALNLEIYIPINKIPKNIITKNISSINENMTLADFGKKFNLEGLENIPLDSISKIGLHDYYILMISVSLLVISMVLILLLIEPSKRLIAPGISLILSGFISLGFSKFGTDISKFIVSNFSESVSINKIVFLTVVPPIITDVSATLFYIGITCVVVGGLLFLVKKFGRVQVKTHSLPN